MPPSATFLVALLAVVAIVTLIAPRLRIPTPILLALAGIGVAFVPGVGAQRLDPNLIMLVPPELR